MSEGTSDVCLRFQGLLTAVGYLFLMYCYEFDD